VYVFMILVFIESARNITDGNDLPEQERNIAGSGVLHAGMSMVFTNCCVYITVPGSSVHMETALVLACPQFDFLHTDPCIR